VPSGISRPRARRRGRARSATCAKPPAAGCLHHRLAMPGPSDEIKDLADTIDGLLGRLETAFDSQRRFVANASHELRTSQTLERALVLAPWNTVFARQRPVAFIDWDTAAPGPSWWDVAYALWHFVPLYGDPASDPFDLAVFEPRARRSRLLCEAYGLQDPEGLVDRIIQRQRTVYRIFKDGAQAGDQAYVRLWEMGAGSGIMSQIAYVEAHRPELEEAFR
jgi:phosphotransferase family enzyme